MTAQPDRHAAPLPALPHWEEPPADLPAAIRQVKAALRTRIAASGRTVEEVFRIVCESTRQIPDLLKRLQPVAGYGFEAYNRLES